MFVCLYYSYICKCVIKVKTKGQYVLKRGMLIYYYFIHGDQDHGIHLWKILYIQRWLHRRKLKHWPPHTIGAAEGFWWGSMDCNFQHFDHDLGHHFSLSLFTNPKISRYFICMHNSFQFYLVSYPKHNLNSKSFHHFSPKIKDKELCIDGDERNGIIGLI